MFMLIILCLLFCPIILAIWLACSVIETSRNTRIIAQTLTTKPVVINNVEEVKVLKETPQVSAEEKEEIFNRLWKG